MANYVNIRNAIGGLSVAASSLTPTAYYGATLLKWTPAANLPVRLLVPFQDAGGSLVSFLDADDNTDLTWRVSDLMLWKAMSAGQGIHEVTPELDAYIDNYMTALKANRTLGLGTLVRITGADLRAMIAEYPAQSGTFYFAVRCVVTVNETA